MDEEPTDAQLHLSPRTGEGRPSSNMLGDGVEEQNQKEAPQQIWILCGGDGPCQHLSYQSGLNAWQKLRRSGDLQVYLALLVPVSTASSTRSYIHNNFAA